MKILILGAGQVGANLAINLASEHNDITIVDTDANRLRELADRIDVRIVTGYAALPEILYQAGADDADMLIAVTRNDEVNMVACQVAYTLFQTPQKIARIRTRNYLKHREQLFNTQAFPIDHLISPEQVVTHYISRLLQHPGALQVLDFADDALRLVAIKAHHGGLLVGKEVRYLKQHIPQVDSRVAAIFGKDRPLTPHGDTQIEAGDEVFFLAATQDIKSVMSELRKEEPSYQRIIIAGGGNIGFGLASIIEQTLSVKVIERSRERCDWLAEQLRKTVVLVGDASDRELLLAENIEGTDVFLALTNDDEANIMASLLAKQLGARTVMTLINNPAYVDLMHRGDIDIAISPSQATIGSLLTHVRRADIVNVHSLRRGAAEAIEAIAHGDAQSSKVVGQAINAITLPQGTTIGAIVRDGQVIIAHSNIVIEANDHVILFLIDKRRTAEVERLFQVGLTFI